MYREEMSYRRLFVDRIVRFSLILIMMIPILLASYRHIQLVQADGGDFSINFSAAAPFTYDHDVGGGAFNDATNAEDGDIREELQGGNYQCGDIVTYLSEISVVAVPSATSQTIELNLQYIKKTTGQDGALHSEIVDARINYGDVENGDDYTGSNPGLGGYGLDSGIDDDRQSASTGDTGINGSSIISQTITEDAEWIYQSVWIDDLEAGETIILATDVRIACEPNSSPTGNLQAKFESGRVVLEDGNPTSSVIPGGAQTINFKQIGQLGGIVNPLIKIIKTVTTEDGTCGVDDVDKLIVAGNDVVKYCYAVSNPSVNTLYDLYFVDDNPTGIPFDFCSSGCDNPIGMPPLLNEDGEGDRGDLAPGDEFTVEATVALGTSSIINTVEAEGNNNLTGGQALTVTDSNTAEAYPIVSYVTIDKQGPETATPGSTIAYTITVTNNSPIVLNGVAVTDDLPTVFTFVPSSNGFCSDASQLVTCSYPGTIGSGDSWEFVIDVTVAEGPIENHENSACVTANEYRPSTAQCNTALTTTPVTLAYFSAVDNADTMLFEWSTATETGNLGFNIYVETANGLHRINDMLIPSQVLDSNEPQNYSFHATGIIGDNFYIEDIDILARTKLHGPFTAGQPYGVHVEPDSIDWTAILIEHEAKETQQHEVNLAVANSQTAAMVLDSAKPSVGSAERFSNSSLVNSDASSFPALDLLVDRDGLYRLTYDQLIATGLNLDGVPMADIALINQGVSIPIRVHGGAAFGPGAFIEFFGQAVDTLYTRTNVYRLVVDADMASRVEINTKLSKANATPASYYLETVTVEENLEYSFAAPNGDPWYQKGMLVYTTGKSWFFDINIDNFAVEAEEPATVNVGMWGSTDWPQSPDHHVIVNFNDVQITEELFDGIASNDVTAKLPTGVLYEGRNTLELSMPGDTGAAYDLVNLDQYGITYPRAFVARDGMLTFTAAGKAFRVENLPSEDIVVYRIDGDRVTRLAGVTIQPQDGSFSATFAGFRTPAKYIVSSATSLLHPEVAPGRPDVGITSGTAEYLIISHPDFIDGLLPLIEAREAQGMTVRLTNVEDIYAQYTYGLFDPQAIRDYIAFAAANMDTHYVLLVGGDSYDYHKYRYPQAMSFIPTLYAPTDELIQYAPVDPLFTDIDYDNIPDLALGRFPVRTSAELDALVAKTLSYADKNYGGTALFAADDLDGSISFSGDSESFIAQLPVNWSVKKAFQDELGMAGARTTLLDALNSGVALTSYVGHSASDRWTFDGLFNSNDAAALTNFGRPTVVSQWGCWNTYHVQPQYNSLGHKFLLSGDNGAAAVMGASTLTKSTSESALGQIMMSQLVEPGTAIGEAMLSAKRELAGSQPGLLDVLLGWTILGDPALVIE